MASPLRQMVGQAPNIQVLLGEVVDIDPEAKEVVFNDHRYGYDHLILASGSGSTYFGREEWRPLAPPMKILEHADEIRRRLLMALEEAEQTLDPERRRFLQTVVVVGAGPAGCELAGSLIELMHRAVQREFKQLRQEDCTVVLVDPVERVLPTMAAEFVPMPRATCRWRGWSCAWAPRWRRSRRGGCGWLARRASRSWRRPRSAGPRGCVPRGWARLLAERTGCPVDRGGRLVVEPDFSIPGHPEIRAVGDLCSYGHTADERPLPGMAGPAVQMGGWVARDLLAKLKGSQQSRPSAGSIWAAWR